MIFTLSLTHSLQIQQAKSHLKGWVTIKKQLLIIAALLWLLTTETQRAVVCPMPIQKGITYAAWSAGAYSHPDADLALGHLRATGAEWIGLVVTGYQNNVGATAISINTDVTPTDADLIHAITQAHALGLKVMLKPHVDFSNDTDHWRGEIGTKFTSELQWSAWCDSYRAFIVHYADLAQVYGVDQFAVGTELIGTTQRADDWRAIIAAVRTHYNGPVTYAANHDGEEMQITWWDAVDYIGVDAYYPLTNKNDPTPGELKRHGNPMSRCWRRLPPLGTKPILVTEIGYTSQDGTNRYPRVSKLRVLSTCRNKQMLTRRPLKVCTPNPGLRGYFGGCGLRIHLRAALVMPVIHRARSLQKMFCVPGMAGRCSHSQLPSRYRTIVTH
jgi:hypothetical protein